MKASFKRKVDHRCATLPDRAVARALGRTPVPRSPAAPLRVRSARGRAGGLTLRHAPAARGMPCGARRLRRLRSSGPAGQFVYAKSTGAARRYVTRDCSGPPTVQLVRRRPTRSQRSARSLSRTPVPRSPAAPPRVRTVLGRAGRLTLRHAPAARGMPCGARRLRRLRSSGPAGQFVYAKSTGAAHRYVTVSIGANPPSAQPDALVVRRLAKTVRIPPCAMFSDLARTVRTVFEPCGEGGIRTLRSRFGNT